MPLHEACALPFPYRQEVLYHFIHFTQIIPYTSSSYSKYLCLVISDDIGVMMFSLVSHFELWYQLYYF